MWHAWGRRQTHAGIISLGKLKEGDHLADIGINGSNTELELDMCTRVNMVMNIHYL
jgi:hypothetical protein